MKDYFAIKDGIIGRNLTNPAIAYSQLSPVLIAVAQCYFDGEPLLQEVVKAIQTLCFVYEHCYFMTDSGLLGSAHWSCKGGDVVALLTGVSVPMLLRPIDGRYRIIGRAYIRGAM
jgi:hypothetical protein